jgi:hypothetical protein
MCALIFLWEPNLVHFSFALLLVMVIIHTLFTLCHCVTKRGSIFYCCFWCFRPEMYFQTGQVFLSQNGQRGSLLVFWLNYGWNKNTLCKNGCILTGQSVVQSSCIRKTVFKSESSYIQTSIVHKLLEVIHEESFAKTKTNQLVPVQPSGRAFEGVRTPRSVLQINIEDVRTSDQHRLDAQSISILQGVYFQKSTLFGKYLQSVRTTRHHVRTMSCIWKPSGRLNNTSGRYPLVQIPPEFRLYAERF